MKLIHFKKNYLKNKIQNYIINKKFIFFLQYNNIPIKKHLSLKNKCNNLNLHLKSLNNKSNFLKNNNFNLFLKGQSCIIYPSLETNSIENLFKLLFFLKKENFLILSLKYHNKIYNLNYLKNYKKKENILFNIFFTLNKIKNPNKNLINL